MLPFCTSSQHAEHILQRPLRDAIGDHQGPQARLPGSERADKGHVTVCAGKKKSTKEKRELRKAKKKDTTEESTLAARKATPEELAAAGARLGPRAQV